MGFRKNLMAETTSELQKSLDQGLYK